jgi:hypothetical protein
MMLLTPQIRLVLLENGRLQRAVQHRGGTAPDLLPIVKFFNPCGAATWLATELDEDCDSLFGLSDLGFGCPELGYFSLSEIEALRLPGGLRIERDIHFDPRFPLSAYVDAARIAGRITEAEALLATAARARALRTPRLPGIPPAPDG